MTDFANLIMTADASGLKQGEQALENLAAKGAQAEAKVAKATTGMSKGMRDFGGSAAASGQKVQNASFQIADFFVQIEAGTPISRALGQQLPQLLGGFGALGAALGAGVAIGGAFISMLFDTADSAKEMKKALDNLNDRLDEYKQFAKLANASSKELYEQFGNLSSIAREMYEGMAKLNHIQALQTTAAAAAKLREQFSGMKRDLADIGEAQAMPAGTGGLETALYLTEELKEKYGLTVDQARQLMQLIDQMGQSGTMREQAEATAAVASFLQDAATNGKDVHSAAVDAAVSATELALATAEVAANTDDASGSMSSVVSQTDDWAAAMSGVRAEIGAIASALASMGGGMISNAGKFVELNALRQGRTIAEAARERQRLQMETEFTAREAAAGSWVERMLIKGERGLAERGLDLDEQLNAARDSARERDRASTRKGRSGGGRKGRGSGRNKETPDEKWGDDVFEYQRQTEAFLAQADALAKVTAAGGDWERALAVIEEEQQLLNAAQKAGIELTPEIRAGIKGMAEDYIAAEEKLENMRSATERGQDAMRDLFGSILDGADAAKEALGNLLLEIAKIQFQNAAMGLLAQTSFGSSLLQGVGSLLTPSFDGGGYTGDGSRTGGIDGKGGFLAMMHPQETVTDHTKRGGGSGGGASQAVTLHTTIDLRGTTGDKELDAKIARAGQAILSQVPAVMDDHSKRN